MNINQVEGIIESLSNHYRKHAKKNSYHDQAAEILNRRSSSLSISSNAENISEIYSALSKTGDSDAMQAFRDTMVRFSKEGKTEDFVHFIHTAEDLAKSSPNMLRKIFSTVYNIETVSLEKNLSLDAVAWLSNLGYITNSEIDSYIDATTNILSFDDHIQESFHKFISTTGKLVKDKNSDETTIDSYFRKTGSSSNGEEFNEINRQFQSDENND